MKEYERERHESYCNLDTFDVRLGCFVKTKRRYADPLEAREAAKKAGRYRVSETTNGDRVEFEPFEVK